MIVPYEFQTSAAWVLDYITCAIDTFHVADRGHRCSDGHSDVISIISRGKPKKENSRELDPDAMPFVPLATIDGLQTDGSVVEEKAVGFCEKLSQFPNR